MLTNECEPMCSHLTEADCPNLRHEDSYHFINVCDMLHAKYAAAMIVCINLHLIINCSMYDISLVAHVCIPGRFREGT